MTFRTTPPIATWILNQFGALTEDESAIGDLIEKYQRGRGTIWYWRQVMAIVFGGLYREVRQEKRQFLAALVRTWCYWGGLQFLAGILMMMRYRSLHRVGSDFGLSGDLIPLVTFRVLTGNDTRVWDISIVMVLLNILTLLLVGRHIASSSRVHPRGLLLACLTSFIFVDIGLIVTHLLLKYLNQPVDNGFLITDLIALPLVPALLLIGGIGGMRGTRCLTPLTPKR